MASVVVKNGTFSVRAYRGDAKTLLAFNLVKTAARKPGRLHDPGAPPGPHAVLPAQSAAIQGPADHAQDPSRPANSSLNAPIHKFRWLHVPGSAHQGLQPVFGELHLHGHAAVFRCNQSLTPLDPTLSVAVTIEVAPVRQERARARLHPRASPSRRRSCGTSASTR